MQPRLQRDNEDMIEFVRNCPVEFKEYYIQMQAAKRSQAPLPSQVRTSHSFWCLIPQIKSEHNLYLFEDNFFLIPYFCLKVNDDSIILDRTVADQVSMWKSKRGLTDDESVMGHVCSGNTCSYTKIGDVFICEKTGRVHVCDDTCREVVLDQSSGTLVCTISGHCFDSWLSPEEETDADAVRTLQFHPSLLSPFLSLTHTHTHMGTTTYNTSEPPILRKENLIINM